MNGNNGNNYIVFLIKKYFHTCLIWTKRYTGNSMFEAKQSIRTKIKDWFLLNWNLKIWAKFSNMLFKKC